LADKKVREAEEKELAALEDVETVTKEKDEV